MGRIHGLVRPGVRAVPPPVMVALLTGRAGDVGQRSPGSTRGHAHRGQGPAASGGRWRICTNCRGWRRMRPAGAHTHTARASLPGASPSGGEDMAVAAAARRGPGASRSLSGPPLAVSGGGAAAVPNRGAHVHPPGRRRRLCGAVGRTARRGGDSPAVVATPRRAGRRGSARLQELSGSLLPGVGVLARLPARRSKLEASASLLQHRGPDSSRRTGKAPRRSATAARNAKQRLTATHRTA